MQIIRHLIYTVVQNVLVRLEAFCLLLKDLSYIPPDSEVPCMYKCDLCNSVFNNEEKLSNHISIAGH